MKKDNKSSPLDGIIKKVVSVGVGAAFMTEESVKKILEDLPLPKEILLAWFKMPKELKKILPMGSEKS